MLTLEACIFTMSPISKGMGKNMKAWNRAIQQRVSYTSAVLTHIKAVKLSGLGGRLSRDMQDMRVREMSLCKEFRKFVVWMNFVGMYKL